MDVPRKHTSKGLPQGQVMGFHKETVPRDYPKGLLYWNHPFFGHIV
jgi:hypothetical protein